MSLLRPGVIKQHKPNLVFVRVAHFAKSFLLSYMKVKCQDMSIMKIEEFPVSQCTLTEGVLKYVC